MWSILFWAFMSILGCRACCIALASIVVDRVIAFNIVVHRLYLARCCPNDHTARSDTHKTCDYKQAGRQAGRHACMHTAAAAASLLWAKEQMPTFPSWHVQHRLAQPSSLPQIETNFSAWISESVVLTTIGPSRSKVIIRFARMDSRYIWKGTTCSWWR